MHLVFSFLLGDQYIILRQAGEKVAQQNLQFYPPDLRFSADNNKGIPLTLICFAAGKHVCPSELVDDMS